MKLRQDGAALLSAMLTVTLVATFAAAALWQQYRSIEVEAAERARVQVAWLLVGALDWSRLILRIDGRAGTTDHLAEPWAVALQESRLSTFLAADKNNTGGMTAEESVDAFLSGQMVDAQSHLNVYNLLDAGKVSPPDLAAFSRLFTLLNLPLTELDTLVSNYKNASDTDDVIKDAVPLMPQRVRQLTWLGLRASTVGKLMPYITLLPERTTVNLNTAPAEVIYATVPTLQLADAKLAVTTRESAHFATIADATKAVPAMGQLKAEQHSVSTQFFEVLGRIRLEQTVVEERSLVKRDNSGNVRTLWRERAVAASPDPAGNASASSKTQTTALQ